MFESTQKTGFHLAILFDVDGVLVDSYEAHLESWQHLAGQTGVEFTPAQFAATFGRTSREIIREHWPARLHGEQAVNCLDEQKEAMYREIVADRFPAMEGARELIAEFHNAGFGIALASSGPAANIALAIDRLGIRELVHAVITGADVTRGKPDPQVFLLAAQRLNVQPHQCVVIEDAPAGIAAARTARMLSIALLSRGRSRDDFIDAPPTEFIQSLRELSAERLRAMLATRE